MDCLCLRGGLPGPPMRRLCHLCALAAPVLLLQLQLPLVWLLLLLLQQLLLFLPALVPGCLLFQLLVLQCLPRIPQLHELLLLLLLAHC